MYMARSMLLTSRPVLKKVGKAGGGWNQRISDEQVVQALLDYMSGKKFSLIAQELSITRYVLRSWIDGINRADCLLVAEKEFKRRNQEKQEMP